MGGISSCAMCLCLFTVGAEEWFEWKRGQILQKKNVGTTKHTYPPNNINAFLTVQPVVVHAAISNAFIIFNRSSVLLTLARRLLSESSPRERLVL